MARKINFIAVVYAVIDFITIAVVSFSFGISSSLCQVFLLEFRAVAQGVYLLSFSIALKNTS